jgi:hypothetical protein
MMQICVVFSPDLLLARFFCSRFVCMDGACREWRCPDVIQFRPSCATAALPRAATLVHSRATNCDSVLDSLRNNRDFNLEVSKLWLAPLGGGQGVCMTNIYIFNEIGAQDKIYILVDTLLG